MNNSQLINQTSGNTEIYTPLYLTEAARHAMGGTISLDPASSEIANKSVGALRWFGIEANGLNQKWDCRTLWMNHPFSREGNPRWINKLVSSWCSGDIKEAACCITFASTSEEWFRPLLNYPQCYLWPRTNYLKPDGTIYKGVTKGSVVTYFGRDVDKFRYAFLAYGTTKI